MKRPWLLLLTGAVQANIIFEHAPLPCDPTLPATQGCLRGQYCSDSGNCEYPDQPPDVEEPPSPIPEPRQLNYPCDQEIFGDLGGEATQDGVNCISEPKRENTLDSRPPDVSNLMAEYAVVTPVPTSTRPANTSVPSNTSVPDAPSPPSPEQNVTVDGMCGSTHNDTLCGDWPLGSCCSPYGFCGNSTSHCGQGCQSGPCLEGSILKPLMPMAHAPPNSRGEFRVVGQSGVPAMIAILMPNGKVTFADKIENYTQALLDNGNYAYSVEYDPNTNDFIPLSYKTNIFCAGGVSLADGRALAVGGNGPLKFLDPSVDDGFRGIRYLERRFDDPNPDYLSWEEPGHTLSTPRWYPSTQVLRDGRIFVVSGSANGMNPTVQENNNPTYEILDRDGYPYGESILLPILERNQPYYMYPFLHLLKDGNVFIFVSRSAEIFNVEGGYTVKTLPDLRGDYRTYPNTGGSVLLPLSSSNEWEPEVMVCGGGAFQDLESPTDSSCGRIRPLSDDPSWELESMPSGRGMVEGILMPDGTVVWINGCNRGAQGFGVAKDPIYEPWIYNPKASQGERWAIGASSEIARMYHSVALLLLDGTIMIAGSNPVEQPILYANPNDPMRAFVTEFRVEIYTPHYLMDDNVYRRPQDVWLSARYLPADGRRFVVGFNVYDEARSVKVALYQGGFVTHSLHMGHRMLYLDTEGWQPGQSNQEILVSMPPSPSIAPPGPYVIYVVVDGVPSVGQFVMVEND